MNPICVQDLREARLAILNGQPVRIDLAEVLGLVEDALNEFPNANVSLDELPEHISGLDNSEEDDEEDMEKLKEERDQAQERARRAEDKLSDLRAWLDKAPI